MNVRDIHSLDGLAMVRDAEGYTVDTLAHHVIDGVYTKVFIAIRAGVFLGQHAHVYDHGTLVAAGEFRLFIDGRSAGDFKAGDMVPIKRGVKHVLLALENRSVGCCIHNTHGADEPAILEEATL